MVDDNVDFTKPPNTVAYQYSFSRRHVK